MKTFKTDVFKYVNERFKELVVRTFFVNPGPEVPPEVLRGGLVPVKSKDTSGKLRERVFFFLVRDRIDFFATLACVVVALCLAIVVADFSFFHGGLSIPLPPGLGLGGLGIGKVMFH